MSLVALFANPIAGRGRGAAISKRLRLDLADAGFSVIEFTDPPEQIGVDRLNIEMSAAVVIGGDGTLRAVVDRLRMTRAEIPPICVVPLGTANLMGKHLAISWRGKTPGERVVRAIRNGKVRYVDAGVANDRLFLLMAGVGIDGQVVHELAAVRKGPIDYLSYVLPAAFALGRYAFPSLTVTLDGKRRFGPRPGIAFVGNVAEYGTGFPILPHARSDDGLFDVCALPCATRGDLIQLLMRATGGEHLLVEGALYATARNVRIESSQSVPVQIDGDAAGHTPLQAELLHVRVPFIVD